jgi:hypothetical protein
VENGCSLSGRLPYYKETGDCLFFTKDGKYVIKEAEIVVSNYIKRIEDNLADRKIDRLKKSYKKTKKLNIFHRL